MWLIGGTGEVSGSSASVCGRTAQVRDAIVAASGASTCGEVSGRQLRDVTELELANQGIARLRDGDLDGLARLDTLDLSGNLLVSLPRGVFDELYLLTSLYLDGNLLETLPAGIFDELFLLEELRLDGNRFTSLPDTLFEAFSRLDGIQANGDPPDNSGPYPRLQRFLDRHRILSPEEFIAVLPALYRERFVMVYASAAAAAAHVSMEHPRIASWGADGQFIFAWNTDPAAPVEFRESVEFLRQDDFAWTAGIVDFSGATPEITEPSSCAACHGPLNKPLWGEWATWDGSEYIPHHRDDTPAYAASLGSLWESSKPRIAPLDFSASDRAGASSSVRFLTSPGELPYVAAVEEAGAVWSWRHAEVLFRILRARHRDFGQWGAELVCQTSDEGVLFQPTVRSFAQSEHNLFIAANADFVITDGLVDGVSDLVRYNYYYHPDGSVGDALIFLTIVELWQTEPLVRHLYRETSNAETTSGSAGVVEARLHYPSGAATAEDELIQKLRLHFGRGGRTALKTRARQHDGFPLGVMSASFWDGHAELMRGPICRALRKSAPGNLQIVQEDGDLVLRWESPGHDPSSITGYRILRGVDGARPAVHVTDTDSTGTSWTDDGPPGGDVAYVVRAWYDGYYLGPESDEAEATVAAEAVALSAVFEEVPADHDGATAFQFRLRFSEPVSVSYRTLRDESLQVTGGHAARARRLDGRSDLWEIEVEPRASADIVVTLPATADCAGSGAVCTGDGRPLSAGASATIPLGSTPLTASVHEVPDAHDGETEFTFVLRFSEEFPVSFRTLRDESFEVTGGTVRRAGRLVSGSNLGWRIHVEPASDADITLVLPANRACGTPGAICTADGRQLSNRLELAVPGPG